MEGTSSSIRNASQSFFENSNSHGGSLCRLETLNSYDIKSRDVYYLDPSRLGIYTTTHLHLWDSCIPSLFLQLKPLVFPGQEITCKIWWRISHD